VPAAYLSLGKPSPMIPLAPESMLVLFVLVMTPKTWFSRDSPATMAVSMATWPLASVPVNESPYSRSMGTTCPATGEFTLDAG
jgi:hypothetical protein